MTINEYLDVSRGLYFETQSKENNEIFNEFCKIEKIDSLTLKILFSSKCDFEFIELDSKKYFILDDFFKDLFFANFISNLSQYINDLTVQTHCIYNFLFINSLQYNNPVISQLLLKYYTDYNDNRFKTLSDSLNLLMSNNIEYRVTKTLFYSFTIYHEYTHYEFKINPTKFDLYGMLIDLYVESIEKLLKTNKIERRYSSRDFEYKIENEIAEETQRLIDYSELLKDNKIREELIADSYGVSSMLSCIKTFEIEYKNLLPETVYALIHIFNIYFSDFESNIYKYRIYIKLISTNSGKNMNERRFNINITRERMLRADIKNYVLKNLALVHFPKLNFEIIEKEVDRLYYIINRQAENSTIINNSIFSKEFV